MCDNPNGLPFRPLHSIVMEKEKSLNYVLHPAEKTGWSRVKMPFDNIGSLQAKLTWGDEQRQQLNSFTKFGST